MSSNSLHKVTKIEAWKLWSCTVLQPFDIQRHIAPFWKALNIVMDMKKLKGTVGRLGFFMAPWNTPFLLHKIEIEHQHQSVFVYNLKFWCFHILIVLKLSFYRDFFHAFNTFVPKCFIDVRNMCKYLCMNQIIPVR